MRVNSFSNLYAAPKEVKNNKPVFGMQNDKSFSIQDYSQLIPSAVEEVNSREHLAKNSTFNQIASDLQDVLTTPQAPSPDVIANGFVAQVKNAQNLEERAIQPIESSEFLIELGDKFLKPGSSYTNKTEGLDRPSQLGNELIGEGYDMISEHGLCLKGWPLSY